MKKIFLSLGLMAACGPDVIDAPAPVFPTVAPVPFGPGLGIGSPVITSERGLEPITGGTIKALRDNARIVVADPDRSRVIVFDRPTGAVREIPLAEGSRPFRVLEHGDRVSVVLRGTGELATFDPSARGTVERRSVCPMPRGLAFDAAADRLLVACAGGELVSLPQTGGAARVVARLLPDLRDVVVSGELVSVSRFRSTEMIFLSRSTFEHVSTTKPKTSAFTFAKPTVAWRTVPSASGGAMMFHQLAQANPVAAISGGYGGHFDPCGGGGGIVTNAVTALSAGGATTMRIPFQGIPIDIAVDEARGFAAIALMSGQTTQVFVVSTAVVEEARGDDELRCGDPTNQAAVEPTPIVASGEISSVDITPDGQVVAFQAEPPFLHVGAISVALGGESVYDTGRTAFHVVTGAGVACASCHPEGGDDAHTWEFVGMGPRRTQNLAGGLAESAPFHWSGDMFDFGHLVREVLVGRMLGPDLRDEEIHALKRFIDSIPQYKPSAHPSPDAVARGERLFNNPVTACGSCHSGARLGHVQASFDVGTGGAFQVPSLRGLAFRGPFIHNGCANTLAQRFEGACGGGDAHGQTSHLSPSELSDLVAYLESL